MLPRGPREEHASRALLAVVGAVGVLALGGCYHKNPGTIPYAAAEAPARVQRIDAPASDVVQWEVAVRAGSAHDPAGREGTAWLTAELMRSGGTRSMDPQAFDRALADLGGEIDVDVGPEVVRFVARGPAANRAAIEELLGAMVSEPRFDEGAFPDAVQRAKSAIAAHGAASTPALGSDAIRTWVFRGHPYGHLMEGRQGTLETIRAQEVRQFWADRYVRPAVAACVVGAAPAGDALGTALTTLPPRLYRDVTPRIVEPVAGRRILWVDSASGNASIQVGRPLELLPGEADDALVALRVLENELVAKIDTARGLGTVHASLEGAGDDPTLATVQPWVHVSIDASPDNVPFVLRVLFDTLGETKDAAPPDAEALRADLSQAGTTAQQADPCGFALVATLVAPPAAEDLDQPFDADVLTATMRRIWTAEGWKVLVVAPGGQKIAAATREGTPTPPVYNADSTRSSDVDAEDLRIGALPLSFQASPRGDEPIVPPDALFR
jgi:hypothetical protein